MSGDDDSAVMERGEILKNEARTVDKARSPIGPETSSR
jgi:hypothetical protein